MLDLIVMVDSEELIIWHHFKAQHFFFFPAPFILTEKQLPPAGRLGMSTSFPPI